MAHITGRVPFYDVRLGLERSPLPACSTYSASGGGSGGPTN